MKGDNFLAFYMLVFEDYLWLNEAFGKKGTYVFSICSNADLPT